MTWALLRAEEEYRFAVDGEATLPVARNPDDRQFIPNHVIVTYSNNNLTGINVMGPMLSAQGRPLSTKRGMTGYDSGDVADTAAGTPTANPADKLPGWLMKLVASVDNGRTPGLEP